MAFQDLVVVGSVEAEKKFQYLLTVWVEVSIEDCRPVLVIDALVYIQQSLSNPWRECMIEFDEIPLQRNHSRQDELKSNNIQE